MPFAVELYFDQQTETEVRAIWNELADNGISDAMSQGDACPHVSLGVYRDLEISSCSDALSRFAGVTSRLDVTLASLGLFPTSEGVVFLAPVVTSDLLNLHERFHRQFAGFSGSPWSYYLPGNWVPHCTLAIGISSELLPRTIEICERMVRPFHGRFERVGIVEFPPVSQVSMFELTSH
jgi:2'-5' RNA ligase